MSPRFTHMPLKQTGNPLARACQRGAAMIEVLIAVLVLAVALAALGKFQGALIQNSGHSKARAIAAQLAQEKLDDLRSFTGLHPLDANQALIIPPSNSAGAYYYAEIGANTGGTEQVNGTLNVPAYSGATKVTVSNEQFNRTWAVQDFYLSGSAATKAWPDYKRVIITVSWVDKDGTQSVVLNGVINSTDPITDVLSTTGVAPVDPPNVVYTPGTAPNVIPINVKPTEERETSTPEPEITNQGLNTKTSFDIVNYHSTSLNTVRRESFSTINCICKQNGSGSTGLTPAADSDQDGHLDETTGVKVSKRYGSTATGGQNNGQPVLCDVCCRDHHDANGGGGSPDPNEYDPFRPASEYLVSGDHKHYIYNNSVLTAADNTNDLYEESCRFHRIDGFLRLVRDWRLEKLNLLPANFLTSGSNVTAYRTYVEDFIEEYINAIPNNGDNASNPPNIGAFTTALAGKPTSISLDTNVSEPEADRQLHARGIYLDYMDAAKITDLKSKIAASSTSWLAEVPFYEVNITGLADWTSSVPNVATVTDEPLQTGNTHSRGLVDDVAAGTTTVTTQITRSNTGVTESDPVDPDDATVVTNNIDTISVNVTGGAPPPPPPPSAVNVSVFFDIDPGVSNTNGDVTFSPPATACTLIAPKPSALYQCVLDGSGNGTVYVSGENTGQNKVCRQVNGVWDALKIDTYTYSGATTLSPVIRFRLVRKTNNTYCT